jgi:amino acid transporter
MGANEEILNLLWVTLRVGAVIFAIFYLLVAFVAWRQVSIVDDQVITPSKSVVEILNLLNVVLVAIAFIFTLIVMFL